MPSLPPSSPEASLVAELNEYQILDATPDETLDDLTGMAAAICEVPIAVVSLIDADRLWFKSAIGCPATRVPRAASFCTHVIEQREIMVVPDATQDPRFAENPAVTGERQIHFYAGAPLISPKGHVVGVLCVIDHVPRQLTPVQVEALRVISLQVMARMELKRRNVELERIKKELQETDERWRLALEGSEEGVWDWNLETNQIYFSERWCTMLGYSSSEIRPTLEEWSSRVHPDDYASTWVLAKAHLDGQSPYYLSEHRMRAKDGSYRWILDRGKVTLRSPDGKALRFVGTHCDITERKIAEEVSSRLTAIVESSQDAIIGEDLNGNVTHWNKGAEKIFGYSSAEMVGHSIVKVIPPGRHGEEDLMLERVRRGENVEDLETVRLTKDGKRIDISVSVSPIKDPTGNVIGVSKVSRDISDRRQANRQIHRLNRVYSVLSEINQVIVREKSPQVLLEAACRIAVEKGGFRMVWIGFVDTATSKVKPSASAGVVDGYLEEITIELTDPALGTGPAGRALRSGECSVSNDIEHDPGFVPWREKALARGYRSSGAFPFTLGEKVLGVINFYSSEINFFDTEEQTLLRELGQDIAFALEVNAQEVRRRETEQALRTSERQFACAFEFAAIGMALVSTEGHWLKVNRAICQIVGYTAEELLTHTFQDITHPDDLQTDLNYVHQLLAGEIESYQMEKRYFHKAGQIVWVTLSVSLVRDDFGKPVHFIAQIQDITERRRIEEQYRQSQKMEAIGQLAGGVAHDFNNILAAIMMQADMAALDPNVPRHTREMLGEIEASAQRAANLTRQLLAFGRRQVMQQTQLDLNDIVRNLAKMLRRVLGEELHLNLNLSPKPLQTRADAGMLDQVLLNLAVNARDAMPVGGHLTIETASLLDSEISPPQAALAPGRYVMLSVGDTGHGIAPDVLPHIFEPFFTTKNPDKGTGLGLATVFGIIKQHGGAITVNTKLGEGSTFQLFLPAEDAPASPAAESAAQAATTGGGETILVVEDDSAVRMLTCTLLDRAGYHVIDAANGIDALRIWRRHKAAVKLLLTDMVMPEGISGRALAGKLRELNPNLRVVYTSGYSPDIAGKEFVLGRGEEFLQKPCMPSNLLQAIRRCLDS